MGLHNISKINFNEFDKNVKVMWFDKKKIKKYRKSYTHTRIYNWLNFYFS